MINTTHFRIKPLALASGHGRYITVTPEWTLVSVGEFGQRLRNGRFTSETATWIQKWLKKIRWNF
jgi:hypothetical protein